MKVQKTYYYVCTILRAGQKATRQGTLKANDELDAIDRVYEMGRKVWSRPVTEVTIMGDTPDQVLATSTISQKVEHNLKQIKIHKQEDYSTRKPAGMVPHESKSTYWYATEFGTYFKTPTFNTYSQ